MIAQFKEIIQKNYILLLSFLFFILVLVMNTYFIDQNEQFSSLANSFLHFKTYFLDTSKGNMDMTFVRGHYYWPLGPFPAVLLMPFVFLSSLTGHNFYQAFLNFPIGIVVFYLVYLLAKSLNYNKTDRYYWSFAFCFVSIYTFVFVNSSSWYFSQAIATCLMLLFLHLFLNVRRRPWLLGMIIAILLATRPFAALACILFLVCLTFADRKENIEYKKYLYKVFLLSPFIPLVAVWLAYNQFSFGHLFSAGYKEQILTYLPLAIARECGLFSPVHIPGNLYYALLALPEPLFRDGTSKVLAFPYLVPSPWGTSMFFISPYLFYLFLIDYKTKIVRILLGVSLVTFLPIAMYYGIGIFQYGYRYGLDFFPLVFLLLMIGYKNKFGNLNNTVKGLIIIFGFINYWLINILYNYGKM